MQSIFDKPTRDVLLLRIDSLTENSKAQWGKMTIYQMLKHCTLWEEMVQGKTKYKRVFIGLLLGRLFLKNAVRDETPMQRHAPSISALKIHTAGDALWQKKEWISRVRDYDHFTNSGFIHPFFGKMTKEQIGIFVYKHIDHHLRQFNA